MSKLFVVLDIETTGLDFDHDAILEIAWTILDDRLNEVSPVRSFILDHGSNWQDVFSLLRAEEVVRQMHENSGLLRDLMSKNAWPAADIATALFKDVKDAQLRLGLPENCPVHLTGRGVPFDREMLRRHQDFAFLFEEEPTRVPGHWGFHYRLYDLSSVRIAYELANLVLPHTENFNPHRAKDDVLEAVAFAQGLRHEMLEFSL